MLFKDFEFTLSELCELENKLKNEWQEKDAEARQLSKELCDQQSKLNRAEKLLKKLIKEIRAMKEPQIPIHIAEVHHNSFQTIVFMYQIIT